MVKEKDNYYICEECNMAYRDKAMAEKCEAYCKKYQSCSTDIIKHAMEVKK